MSYPVFYVEAGDVLPVLFDSFDGGTGASITMTGLAVTDIEIYKDGSVTQRASDAGYVLLDTDGIDFDSITGIHGFSIDLADNTDAGFYAVGSWYHVVVSAITVDAQAVSFVAAAFRIVSATRGMSGTALPDAAADAAGGLPISDAGGLDLDTQIGTDIDAVLADTNELQGDWTNGGRLDLIIDAILVDTGTTIDDLVDDLESRLGTPSDLGSGATVAANLVDIEAQTDDIGTAGAGLTDLGGMSTGMKAEVNAEALDVLNTDTFAEPSGVPGATVTLAAKLGFLYMALRNKITVTATKKTFFDDGDAAEWEKDLSDDGTTYTETEGNAI